MCCIKLFVIPSHRVHSFTCTLPQSRVHACYRSAAHGKSAARGTPAPPQPPPHAPARSQALQPPRRIANLKPARNQVKRRNGEDQSRQTNRRMKRTLNGTWTREDAIDAHDARAQRAVQLHVLPLVQWAAALCRRDRIACTHRPILRSLRSELEREGAVGRDRRRVLSRDGAQVLSLPDVADGGAAADAKVGKVGGDVLSSVSACARRTPLVSKQTTWRSLALGCTPRMKRCLRLRSSAAFDPSCSGRFHTCQPWSSFVLLRPPSFATTAWLTRGS